MIRASASSVMWIRFPRQIISKTLKAVFTVFLSDARHERVGVEKKQPSSLALFLGEALNLHLHEAGKWWIRASISMVVAQFGERHANRACIHAHERRTPAKFMFGFKSVFEEVNIFPQK